MKNKKVKARFDGLAWEHWRYSRWIDNGLVNGWMGYKEGDFDNERYDQKYVSLTADQLKEVK